MSLFSILVLLLLILFLILLFFLNNDNIFLENNDKYCIFIITFFRCILRCNLPTKAIRILGYVVW